MIYSILGLFCYLYYSIPFNHLFILKNEAISLDEIGSKQTSISNSFRHTNPIMGIILVGLQVIPLVLLLYSIDYLLVQPSQVKYFCLLISMLGNMYPVFHHFKGSKGRTLLIWGLLYLSPLSLFVMAFLWSSTYKLFQKPWIGSVLNCVVLPFIIFWQEESFTILILALLTSVLVLVNESHRKSDFA